MTTNFTVDRANRFIKENKDSVNRTFKPQKHFSAEIGWINDPNGFIYFKGEYHLFYQFYPYDSVWGPMHWGHAKSKDLVNWEHLPVALAPDSDFDRNGCFSGSAIVKDDQLWLMYTGHLELEDGSVKQVQNMAYSEDGIHFEKIAQNPVATGDMLPIEVSSSDFRDPKIFEKDGHYYAVVASQHQDKVGCIVLLGSEDIVNWKFESIFLKGEPHQGFVFECPDYFELDGHDCLILSPMRYEREKDSYHNINSNILMTGKVDWDQKVFIPSSVEEIDHGQDFYAAQTLLDNENRRIMIAWMQTWGRTRYSHEKGHKWSGAMTIPRQLRLDEKGKLRQNILPVSLAELVPTQVGQILKEASVLTLELNKSRHFIIGEAQDYLEFGYDSQMQQVYIDRSHLALPIVGEEAEDTSRRFVTIQAEKMTVILDTNSIEIFVNDGDQTLTATFYLDCEYILNEVKG